ncbi:MAG: hypothetical protein QGG36_04790 [Pirellulaceae bacterium]|jgi:hypothetical protein|nr:hypothetical protein [Pirellulaceae bacterium]MDP7015089.1 hypothetical protein [Pirellulaceae bacterium]
MDWLNDTLELLASTGGVCGYQAGQCGYTEPTAAAAIALMAHGRAADAKRALDWLAQQQSEDGSLGVAAGVDQPRWPTGWAVLAWRQSEAEHGANWSPSIDRGVAWILSLRGRTFPRSKETFGHDTTLTAWPWVAGTHSWIEPTSLQVLALRSAGEANHPRTTEATRMLHDRLLPGGGCNYGNTRVLGQELRPHVQPSGMALAALASSARTPRWRATRDYVREQGAETTAAASLAWSIIGLTSVGARPASTTTVLSRAAARAAEDAPSPYRLALLAAAAADRTVLSSSRSTGEER